MRSEKEYEQALLEWRWRQLRLQRKYKDTAAGFVDSMAERQAFRQWKEEVKEFKESREHRLVSEYVSFDEIFVGRKEYLVQIREALKEKAGPVILYGIGGIGKSALARAYIKTYEAEYDHILFLSFNTSLQSMICDDYNLEVSNLQYSKEQYGSKARYFQVKCETLVQMVQKFRVLMIIDDLNTTFDREMEKVFSIPCDILVTTRMDPSFWGVPCRGIFVKELQTEAEWEAFTESYRIGVLLPEDREQLRQYRKKVHGHTLKMMLKIRSMEKEEEEMTGFEENLFRRFPLKKEERRALLYLSVMPVQGIPRGLFLELSQISEAALERLGGFLLIQKTWSSRWKDEMISLHPIIAEAAVKIFRPSPVNCSCLLKGMERYLNGESPEKKNTWGRTHLENQSLEPYVLSFVKAFPQPAPWLASAFDELVTFLWIQEYFPEAEAYSLLLFVSVEAYYGECHQLTGQMALRTAAVYYNEMKFSVAGKWYIKGLTILEHCRVHDRSYWYARASANIKVSRMYRHEKKYDQAMALAEEALRCAKNYQKEFADKGEQPRIVMGFCLLEQSKLLLCRKELREAECVCREAMESVLAAMPEDSFLMNEIRCLMVDILIEKGACEEAEQMAGKALEEAARFRGESFKNTLICRETLADIYRKQGKTEEALREYELVLKHLCRNYPYEDRWKERLYKKIGEEPLDTDRTAAACRS
ncbi:MAG: NB-ARC domain-containing protein [Clostridiaceae bacterium]|nr:NB-ARC domain-containing protein [Clostridiaceae bacterium]